MPHAEINRDEYTIKLIVPTNKRMTKKDREKLELELNQYTVEIQEVQALSSEQRALIYILLKQIADEIGDSKYEVEKDLRLLFENKTSIVDFSLSSVKKNALTVEQANEFINFIMEFAIEEFKMVLFVKDKNSNKINHIRTSQYIDIDRYVIACLKSRVCAICGKEHADLHHWDSVNTIGGYEHDDGLQLRIISLCRYHHNEFHAIEAKAFEEKYHICGILPNIRLIYSISPIYPNQFKKYKKQYKEGYYDNKLIGIKKEEKHG